LFLLGSRCRIDIDQHAIDNTLGKLTGSYSKFLAVQEGVLFLLFFCRDYFFVSLSGIADGWIGLMTSNCPASASLEVKRGKHC
jgi:hypothetical protein